MDILPALAAALVQEFDVGQANLAVEDATSLRLLVELVDRLETIEAIREGMRQIEEDQGMSLEEFKEAVHKKYGIPL